MRWLAPQVRDGTDPLWRDYMSRCPDLQAGKRSMAARCWRNVREGKDVDIEKIPPGLAEQDGGPFIGPACMV